MQCNHADYHPITDICIVKQRNGVQCFQSLKALDPSPLSIWSLSKKWERKEEKGRTRREGQVLLSAFWKMGKWCFQVCVRVGVGVLKFLMDSIKTPREQDLKERSFERLSFCVKLRSWVWNRGYRSDKLKQYLLPQKKEKKPGRNLCQLQ